MTTQPTPYPAELYPGCPCWKCDSDTWPTVEGLGFPLRVRMSLCPTCGNKRCPGAADHDNECTNSNEPGQPGSLYEDQGKPLSELGCPDEGTCHHGCETKCWRVTNAEPLSDVYPDDEWPEHITFLFGERDD